MEKFCITCGMPLEGKHADSIGLELPEGLVCKFDCENGKMKTPSQIFEGGVHFFGKAVANGDQALAERLTRKNMKQLPYWQGKQVPELEGPEATDQEYASLIAKLQN